MNSKVVLTSQRHDTRRSPLIYFWTYHKTVKYRTTPLTYFVSTQKINGQKVIRDEENSPTPAPVKLIVWSAKYAIRLHWVSPLGCNGVPARAVVVALHWK